MTYNKKKFSDDELYNEWLEDIEFAEKTIKNYTFALKLYCETCDMMPTDLVESAEADLQSDKLPRQYDIKKMLSHFYKEISKKSDNTRAIYMSGVKSFYRHFEIPLPKINNGKTKKVQTLMKNDWCGFGKDTVRKCLTHCNSRNRAIILSIVSGSLAKAEMLNLKLDDIGDIDEKGITTLKLQRKKSGMKFTTFLTTEATEAIQEYLQDRKKRCERLGIVDNNPYLFTSIYKGEISQLDGFAWNMIFIDLAEKMGKEYQTEKGTFNMLRGHNFRKFFKTQMQNSGMAFWQVEHHMAHTPDALEKAYFIEDGDKMKEKYIKHMESVTITGEIIREVNIEESQEFQKLKAQNQMLLERVANVEMQEDKLMSKIMLKLQKDGVIQKAEVPAVGNSH